MPVYLLHIEPPYEHARHYVGYTASGVRERVERHRRGQGARLCQVAVEAGRELRLVRVWWHGTRALERRIKAKSAVRCCPVCSGKEARARYRGQDGKGGKRR